MQEHLTTASQNYCDVKFNADLNQLSNQQFTCLWLITLNIKVFWWGEGRGFSQNTFTQVLLHIFYTSNYQLRRV